MSRWNIKTSSLVILSCLVFLMVLILVLPDVDLPDFTFHRGTAPILVHSQATAAPAAVIVAAVLKMATNSETFRPLHAPGALAASPDPNFRPILLRSIRR
jgi:hypothetical protein